MRTVWRLIKWEVIRRINRPIERKYVGGLDITLMPDEGASRLTYYFGVSEPELFKIYAGFLKPGMVVVDAGANIGLHTLLFSKRVGSNGKVYAFEPGQSAFHRLLNHVERNRLSNVKCFHCALGAEEARVSLVENSQDNSRSFVVSETRNSNMDTIVPLRSLDQVLAEENIEEVNFLKLDVEGFESEVLKGARSYLKSRRIRVLQLELDESSLARSGSASADICGALLEYGYRRAEWSDQNGRFKSAATTSFNTFFVTEKELIE